MHNAARAEYDRSWDAALELEIAILQYRIYVPSLPRLHQAGTNYRLPLEPSPELHSANESSPVRLESPGGLLVAE
jgi:hypothetical protein